MSKLLLRSLGAFPLFLVLSIQAQTTTFYVSDIDASHGEVIEVPLSVEEFREVAAAQLSIKWNPEQLEFLGVSDLALNATEDGNFNLRRSEAGTLSYSFIDPTLQGYELQNGSELYHLRFKVLAQAGDEAEVLFAEQPTRCVVGNPQGTEKAAEFVGGTVRVIAGEVSNPPAEVQIQINPNPFSQTAQIVLDVPARVSADLNVYELEGRLVYNKIIDLDAGRNLLPISAADLPAAGTYVVELSAGELRLTRKFVFTGRK
ncbi:MAG: cohesin domain-containing protein [Bacteroidota bacterium]